MTTPFLFGSGWSDAGVRDLTSAPSCLIGRFGRGETSFTMAPR
jgi:hypothetical protein